MNLPSDFKTPKTLFYDGSTYFGELELTSESELSRVKVLYGQYGVPRFYAISEDGAAIQLAPEPASGQSYSATFVYIAALEVLSDSNTTNWVLTNHPDIYLYGALAEAEPFLKNDARVALWKSQFQEALTALRNLNEDRDYGEQALVMRPKRPIG